MCNVASNREASPNPNTINVCIAISVSCYLYIRSTSKSKAHFKFINPDSEDGKEIRNVLVRDRFKDQDFPFKPKQVCDMVTKRTGRNFIMHNHTKAWKYFKVRPNSRNKQPENTDKITAFITQHTIVIHIQING